MIRGEGDINTHYPASETSTNSFCAFIFAAIASLLTSRAALRRLWQYTREDRVEYDIMSHPNMRHTLGYERNGVTDCRYYSFPRDAVSRFLFSPFMISLRRACLHSERSFYFRRYILFRVLNTPRPRQLPPLHRQPARPPSQRHTSRYPGQRVTPPIYPKTAPQSCTKPLLGPTRTRTPI